MFRFDRKSFLIAAVLFLVEVLIAAYLHDTFIRPYFGDFLVVFLVYYAVKAVLDLPVRTRAIGVWLFTLAIEGLQFLNFVEVVGLQHYTLVRVVLGSYFEWLDLLMYTLGTVAVMAVEKVTLRRAPGH